MTACGFDAKFIDLPNHLACPICHVGMKDPKLTICGHRACHGCLEPLQRGGASFSCPVCQTKLTENQMFPDNAVKPDVLNLIVKCDRGESGCEWKGELRELEKHDEECQYLPLQCSLQCGERVMRREMGKHTETECVKRKVVCNHCELDFESQHLSNHSKECPKHPIDCPQRCNQTLLRCQIEDHVSSSSSGICPNTMVDCPLKEGGCKVRCKRVNMKSHMEKYVVSHVSTLTMSHSEMKKEIAELKEEIGSALCVHTWLVTEWSEKLKKTTKDKTICYESSAFYISEPGHHMKMRLYPNSNYSGCIALDLICVKGDYDSVIKWPFRQKFRLIIVNQRETKNDVERDMSKERLEEKWSSFYNKPDNRGVGFQMVKHDDIDKYSKEDQLFAKVVVYGR